MTTQRGQACHIALSPWGVDPCASVVAAEPVTSIDVTSADVLAALEQSLRASGIELRFAEMKDPVTDKLKRFELFEDFGAASFHPTVGAAVDAYLEEHSVDWKP